MKNLAVLFSLTVVIFISSCGPAAEDREAMYARAKVFQDSIAKLIKTSMDDAAAPAPGMQAAPVTTAAAVDTTKK